MTEERFHLLGIGGVGMSALAQALLDSGAAVSGADRLLDTLDLRTPEGRAAAPALAALAAQGVILSSDSATDPLPVGTTAVVVSSAIEASNPALREAVSRGLPVIPRAQALARVLAGYKLAAVAGTCGKSTVTAMLGHVLAGTGFDPAVVNGAAVPGWNAAGARVGSVRRGRGAWAVAEVDESDKSLMAFRPAAAIVTNASADHFGLDETQGVFDSFRAQVAGPVVDGRDGAAPEEIELDGWSGSFTFQDVRYTVPAPGLHNVYNAWNAVRLAVRIGAAPAALAAALRTFPGVERRLQRVGFCGEAAVIDDYAHNPAKLSAMWTALADAFPRGVAVVWRPHGYGPLRKMMDPLADSLRRLVRPQDALLLLPVYDAGGTADRSVSSADLASRLAGARGKISLVPDLAAAEAALRSFAPSVGALVTAGARDPGLPVLARKLAGGSR